MATTQRLGVDIVAADKTARAFANVQRHMRDMGRAANMARGLVGGIFGGFTAAGVTRVLSAAVNHMDEMGNAAQRVGMGVEPFSRLEYAARLADVEMGTLEGSMGRLNRQMVEIASGGSNDAAIALKALGISAVDSEGRLRPTEQVLADVADAFAGAKDGAEKGAIAVALFGKSGADMIPFLNAGSAAIDNAGKQADAFGVTVTTDMAAAADAFDTNMKVMAAAGQGLIQRGLVPAMTASDELVKSFIEFSQSEAVVGATTAVMEDFFTGLGAVIKNTQTDVENLVSAYQTAKGIVGHIGDFASLVINQEPAPGFNDAEKGKGDLQPGMNLQRGGIFNPPAPFGPNNPIEARPFRAMPQLPSLPAVNFGSMGKTKTEVGEVAKAFEKLKAEGQSLWEQTRTPLEEFQMGIRHMNELQRAGVIDAETYGRAISGLQDDYLAASTAAQATAAEMSGTAKLMTDTASIIGGAGASAFDGFVSGAQSAEDAVKAFALSAAQDVAKMFMTSGFQQLAAGFGGSVSPSQGGGIGSFLGTLFSSFAGMHADGGRIPAGQWGIAGEAGPEIITGPANVIPMSKRGGSNSGGSVTTITYAPSFTMQGQTDEKAMARVMERERMAFKRMIVPAVREGRGRGQL